MGETEGVGPGDFFLKWVPGMIVGLGTEVIMREGRASGARDWVCHIYSDTS